MQKKTSLTLLVVAAFASVAMGAALDILGDQTSSTVTVVEDGSGNAWFDSDGSCGTGVAVRLAASDNCRSGVNPMSLTKRLKATGFGFSVPTNATILGVQVIMEGMETDVFATSANPAIWWNLLKAGSPAGTTRVYGGQVYNAATPKDINGVWPPATNDLWGTTLTPGDVNVTGFGFDFKADYDPTALPQTCTLKLDHLRMRVYYSVPSGPLLAQTRSVGKVD